MAKIPPGLAAKLQHDPDAPVDLIIRLDGDPSAHLQDLRSLGWTVRRTFSLTPSAAIHGPVTGVSGLANEPWVISIEEDKPVHTQN